eukprot:2740681-Pyramimonas_sp.AAC.1
MGIRLPARKNRPRGSTMWRACACAECGEGACPVHSAGRWLAALPVGAAPWAAASPAQMRRALRATLSAAGLADAEAF